MEPPEKLGVVTWILQPEVGGEHRFSGKKSAQEYASKFGIREYMLTFEVTFTAEELEEYLKVGR